MFTGTMQNDDNIKTEYFHQKKGALKPLDSNRKPHASSLFHFHIPLYFT
jgi:hypothetical protein